MVILIFFAELAWNAPNVWVFGGLVPWTWLVIIETHKRHILGRNRTYMLILVQIRPLVRPVRETKESKKEKKERKKTYSGKLGVRPDHQHWSSDMWSCMLGGLREVVLSFIKIGCRFFEMWGVEICHFLLLWPVLPYKPWYLRIMTSCVTLHNK